LKEESIDGLSGEMWDGKINSLRETKWRSSEPPLSV